MMNKVKTMYLVDDDDIYQFLVKRIVEESHLVSQIKVFSNGLDAINFLKSVTHDPELLPEVILLDLTMPIMDGWEFLEEYMMLKPKIGKKIVIYIASSSIAPSDIERAKSISLVTDYIVKPVTKDKLLYLLKNL